MYFKIPIFERIEIQLNNSYFIFFEITNHFFEYQLNLSDLKRSKIDLVTGAPRV
jgi:hypothetical protein